MIMQIKNKDSSLLSGGFDAMENVAGGWNWQELSGSHSGVPFSDKDYAGATPPYFSMLQIIALFIVFNTPVAIWRFLDCRLTHSPEILPLLVAAQELRRRKASLLVFPGCAREEAGGWRALTGLSDFLSTCHLPVATMHTLDDLGPPSADANSFYVLCIDSPATARAYYAGWRKVKPDQLLLVIDPSVYRTVPELRTIEAIQICVNPVFVKELLQVMGMKLGRFCHALDKPTSAATAPVFALADI